MKGKTACPRCKHEFVTDVPEQTDTHTISCPVCAHSFTIKRVCKNEEQQEECGWEEYGEPRKTILSSMRKKTNRPLIASFLLLASGVLGFVTAVIFYSSQGNIITEFNFVISGGFFSLFGGIYW